MQMHALGKTGLSIAPIVFGDNVFCWTVDEKTSFNILDAFFDAGFNALDTASAWVPGNKGGESEEIIGLMKSASLKLSDEAMGLLDKAGA